MKKEKERLEKKDSVKDSEIDADTVREEQLEENGEQEMDGGNIAEEEKLRAEIEELKMEIKDRKDKYLRLYAEFENYRNRMTRERVDMRKLAAQDTIEKLLPVLDDFNRAKMVADDETTEELFTEGVQLVFEKFKKTLKSCGLEPMESTGEIFDPELHEAFAELPVEDKKQKGRVIDTIEMGYYLNDKIIRHAKVVVGK